ncbi:hypothetical protein J7X22_004645 [Vibrio parahaemolyticus]|nr:hypothetical protein [Vibrio parahaemolyticus]
MKYEHRVVAFIDILGFKALLNDTVDNKGNDDEAAIEAVVSAYEAIRDIWDLDTQSKLEDFGVSHASDSREVSIFSDCLVVSFLVDQPKEVFFTLIDIQLLIMNLLSRNILCRGAISIGKFIHTSKYLFGPALVEAYTLESKAALYPRVILDRAVIEAGIEHSSMSNNSSFDTNLINSLLKQDSDGMYYIDYFYGAQSELNDPEYDFPNYISNLGQIIRKGLMSASHHSKADIRVKYLWMRERYNDMIDIVTSKDAIENLESRGQFDLVNFYKSLKKISPNRYAKQLGVSAKKYNKAFKSDS